MVLSVPIVSLNLLMLLANGAAQDSKATKLLPSYHQEDYDIRLTIFEIPSYNRLYFRDVRAGLFYLNRTQRVINGSGHLLKNLSRHLKLNYQLYKFISNEYRFFPLTVNVNACDEFDRNTMGIAEVIKKHSNVNGCPVKTGFYYFNNIHYNNSQLPPYIPHGNYKAVISFYHNVTLLGEAHCYGIVSQKPLKWKD